MSIKMGNEFVGMASSTMCIGVDQRCIALLLLVLLQVVVEDDLVEVM